MLQQEHSNRGAYMKLLPASQHPFVQQAEVVTRIVTHTNPLVLADGLIL